MHKNKKQIGFAIMDEKIVPFLKKADFWKILSIDLKNYDFVLSGNGISLITGESIYAQNDKTLFSIISFVILPIVMIIFVFLFSFKRMRDRRE